MGAGTRYAASRFCTLEWPLPCVTASVFGKVPAFTKSSVATRLSASVWFVAAVYTHMLYEEAAICICPIAFWTFVWFLAIVSALVHCQVATMAKAHNALCTFVWLFPSMLSAMPNQMVFTCEGRCTA